MGTSQLSLYNKALRHLEERKLVSLTENRESRRYLDDEFEDNNLYCLSQGNWNFAKREIMIDASSTQIPNFGYAYAFQKPSDWNHTFMVSDNDAYDPLARDYTDQNGFWYANITPLYIRYISNDPDYGLNLGIWTPAYIEYVAARLARLCAPRLKQDQSKVDYLETKVLRRAKAEAVSTDSQDLPPGKPPYGTWVQSRAPRGSILPMGSPFGSNED